MINVDFVISDDFPDTKLEESGRCFWVNVENISESCSDIDDGLPVPYALTIDLNALQPGRDTVVAVGPVSKLNRLMLKNGSSVVSICFAKPRE